MTHRIARIVISCLIPVLPAASQDAASQIKAETQGLQQSLKNRAISDPEFRDMNSMAEGALKFWTRWPNKISWGGRWDPNSGHWNDNPNKM